MARVYQQQYTIPIPDGAERITLKVRKRGETKEVPGVRFRRNGKWVQAPLTAKGDRCPLKTETWYGKVKHPDGSVDPVPLGENKANAEMELNRFQTQARTAKALGIPLERIQAKDRTLAEWLEEYHAAVRTGSRRRSKRNLEQPSDSHVRQVMMRVQAVVEGCGFSAPNKITLSAVQSWLQGLQQPRPVPALPAGQDAFRPGELAKLLGITRGGLGGLATRYGIEFQGRGKARHLPREEAGRLLALSCQGATERTASYYAREVKAFTSWLVRQKALEEDPLRDMAGATGKASHRHDRRALIEDEVKLLLSTTRQSPKRRRGLTGEDRWALYLLALSTGFRAAELDSLTPACFRLDDDPPVLLLGEVASKNGRGATQPLPLCVVELVRPWLATRKDKAPLWPGKWLPDAVDILRADLDAAGIPAITSGPDGELFMDFHGLRHSFIARLEGAGVPLKMASELARHSQHPVDGQGLRSVGTPLAGQPRQSVGPTRQEAGTTREETPEGAGVIGFADRIPAHILTRFLHGPLPVSAVSCLVLKEKGPNP